MPNNSSWASENVEELRAECGSRGIEEQGYKKDLVERLEKYEDQERNRIKTIDEQCDAVLLTRVDLANDDEMIEDAKKAMINIIENDEITIGYDIIPLTIGNPAGLGLASLPGQMKVLESKVTALQTQSAALETKSAALETKSAALEAESAALRAQNLSLANDLASCAIQISSLQSQVGDLTLSLEAHRLVRHRFISNFKRRKFGRMTGEDWVYIDGGNDTAHGGDAIADARLYTGPQARRDFAAYKKLYGFPPQIVRDFTHAETISVLNAHASVCASQRDVGSKKFYSLFAEFIERFEEAEYNTEYLVGNPTPLSNAYSAFVLCRNIEVTREIVHNNARDGENL